MEPDLHHSPRRRVDPDVTDWRRHRLEEAGFDQALAGRLAADADVDLHDLLNLVDRGCAPVLAARILAPLCEQPVSVGVRRQRRTGGE